MFVFFFVKYLIVNLRSRLEVLGNLYEEIVWIDFIDRLFLFYCSGYFSFLCWGLGE